MTAALVTLALALLAAAGTAVGLAVALVRAERGANQLELLVGKSGARADIADSELARVRTAAVQDLGRYTALFDDLKTRVRAAEARALACDAPGSVRDDLRSLLGTLTGASTERSLTAADLLPLRAASDTSTPAERPGRAG